MMRSFTWLMVTVLLGSLLLPGCTTIDPDKLPKPTPTPTPTPEPPAPEPPAPVPPDNTHGEYSDPVLQELWRLHGVVRAQTNPQLQRLAPQKSLDMAAQAHANWMAKNKKMSHVGVAGSSFWDRAKAAGYNGRGGGENIAYGYSTPPSVMNGWMNSQGHRENILRNTWEHIGLGYSKATDGRIYWCAVFGYGDKTGARALEIPDMEILYEGISEPETIQVDGFTLRRVDDDSYVYEGTDVPAFFMEAGEVRMLAETNEIRGDKVFRYEPTLLKWVETDIDPTTITPKEPAATAPLPGPTEKPALEAPVPPDAPPEEDD